MSNIDNAADALLAFAEGLRPIFDVADRLKEVGSLDNAIRERKEALAAVIKEHDQARAAFAKERDHFNRTLCSQVETLEANTRKADVILKEADAATKRIVASANERAEAIIQDATDKATRLTEDHARVMAEAKDQLSFLQTEAAQVAARRDEALEHHARVVKTTEEMREAARRVA